MRYGLLLCFVFITTLVSAQAELPNRVIVYPYGTEQFGAENITSLHKLLYWGSDKIIPHTLWDENNFVGKGGGMAYRLVKLGLLDFQIDYPLIIAQHEIYGHGARFREFDYLAMSFEVDLAPPFGGGSGLSSGLRDFNRETTWFETTTINLSGNEANLLLSQNLTEHVLMEGNMHYREGLLYLISKNNLGGYIWLDYSQEGNGTFFGGDMADYILSINNDYGSPGSYYSLERIAKHSLLSALNPLQFYSFYALFKTYLYDGDSKWDVFMLEIGDVKYLPALGYNLTPFGGEFIFDQYLVHNKQMVHLNLNLGDPYFHFFAGAGLEVHGFVNSPRFYFTPAIDVWYQPAFELGGNEVKQIKEGPGAMLSGELAYFPVRNFDKLGLSARLGYKSDGYVMGEQLSRCWVWNVGLAWRIEE